MLTHEENTMHKNMCPDCGSTHMRTEYINDSFEYGSGKDAVELSALLPIKHCDTCGAEFMFDDADKIRHNAICKHLGVLTPAEVLNVRVSLGMSQSKFSEITGIGIASLSRWETGSLIQSKSQDNLIRLLESRKNSEFLEERFRGRVDSISDFEQRNAKVEPKVLSGGRLATAMEAGGYFQLRKTR